MAVFRGGVLMRAGLVLTKIRLRLGDMQKVKFSDYELTSALNDALLILWITLAEKFSRFTKKEAVITLADGRAPLPEDFYTLAAEPDGFQITGDEIVGRADAETATLVYYSLPSPVVLHDDDVRVPLSLLPEFIEMAASVALCDTERAAGIAESAARRIAMKREIHAIPDKIAFP